MTAIPDNDNNLDGPMVFIIIGKGYEQDGDDEGIDIHVMLRAPDDDTAVREALNALAEEGFSKPTSTRSARSPTCRTKSRMPPPIRARSRAKSRSSGSADPDRRHLAAGCRRQLSRKPPGSLRSGFHDLARTKERPGSPSGGFSIASTSSCGLFAAELLGHVRKHRRCGLRTRSLAALFEDHLVARRRDAADLGHGATGTGRDQAADDDVFLQTLQAVGLAGDRGFRQHLRRFLEGSGRDEGRRLQRCLGDAEQNRIAVGRLLALFDQADR